MTPQALRVALGQYDIGWQDPPTSLARAERVVRRAAEHGARLVVLPEMAATGFTMDAAAHAEPLDGASACRLSALAASANVWILAGLATRDAHGTHNSALLFDPRGAVAAEYRKQKLFAYANEHDAYAPGTGAVTADVDGVRVGLFICYDLRFPELFRAVAKDVDALLLVANWPAARQAHWDALVKARAIENQAWMIAVNRIGVGGSLTYGGGSAAYDPWGEAVVAAGDVDAEETALWVDVDAARVEEIRSRYPFLKDM